MFSLSITHPFSFTLQPTPLRIYPINNLLAHYFELTQNITLWQSDYKYLTLDRQRE